MTLDTDRLLPADPAVRGLARDLYEGVREAPIISAHGHVPVQLLHEDTPFADPAELLIRPDHYVTRMLVAAGLDVPTLMVGPSRELWRVFLEHRHLFWGTATGYWLRDQLGSRFGIDIDAELLDPDESFDVATARLREDRFRPRALLRSFGIDVLATTDDPLDDLTYHRSLASDEELTTRVLPTFRPDAYVDPRNPDFAAAAERLASHYGAPADDLDAYLDALADRRAAFIEAGAVSADFGVLEPYTCVLDPFDARALFRLAVSGSADARQLRELGGYLLYESAAMSVRDGLVMTLHPGVHRNHSAPALASLGRDSGHDIPVATEYTNNLQPLLSAFGLEKDFHLILFTVDETTFSRELAPLAGFYPSVYIGAPWWFLDAPDAAARFRSAVTETAGFYRGSGFIDDTRGLTSIPARHDMSRRIESGYLASLVRTGRLSLSQAERIGSDLVDAIPRRAFKL